MALAKRAVLFGIDGAGTFFDRAETPHMDRIFRGGAVCPRVLTEMPSISAQCWGSMLHGVECGWHGLTNSVADEIPYPQDSPWPSVFRAIREARPQAALASFSDWPSVNIGIVEEGLGVLKHNAPDRELVDPAVRYIRETDFTFLFFQFDSADGAGHRYGYGTPEHLQAISRCDGYIGAVVRALEDRGWLKDTLLLVEADHGGTPNYGFGGYHGGATDAERFVSFFAAGPGILSGTFEGMLVRDTPAVILRALGIPQPEGWTARPGAGPLPDSFRGKLLYLPGGAGEEFPRGTALRGKLYRVPGLIGSALDLRDGSLELPVPALEQGWSLTAWVKPEPETDAGLQTLLTLVGEGVSVRLELGSGYLRLLREGAPEPLDITLPADTRGEWLFLTAVGDSRGFGLGAGFGPPERRSFAPGAGMKEVKMRLGSFAGRRLTCLLEELCLWDRALEDRDLQQLRQHYGA